MAIKGHEKRPNFKGIPISGLWTTILEKEENVRIQREAAEVIIMN